jgi:anti-sigma factor RsiW
MSDTVCAAGVDRLMDYLEGLLPPLTVAALDAHVSGCARCQAFIASYSATPRILRDATEVSMPPPTQASLIAWLRDKRNLS